MDTNSKIKAIAEKYGLFISDDDIRYDEYDDTWYITPFEGQGGISCRGGMWYAEGINSFNFRLIREDDWQMFDEIAAALA